MFLFSCIPPKVTSMQNLINIGHKNIEVSFSLGGRVVGVVRFLFLKKISLVRSKESNIQNFNPLAQSVWK